jgi:hypothetical protein
MENVDQFVDTREKDSTLLQETEPRDYTKLFDRLCEEKQSPFWKGVLSFKPLFTFLSTWLGYPTFMEEESKDTVEDKDENDKDEKDDETEKEGCETKENRHCEWVRIPTD